MIEILGAIWLRPWWGLALVLAIAIVVLARRRARGIGDWARAVDPAVMAQLTALGRIVPGRAAPLWVPAAAIAILAVALAGPAIERRDQPAMRNLDGVVVVLDLSPSVTAAATFTDALTAARLVAAKAGTRQTALIVYAGEAYLAHPLSTDLAAFMGTVALLEAETLPVEGTRPGSALMLAADVLDAAQILAADVVLISDGGGLDSEALGAAQRLAEGGAALSAIRLPGAGDGPWRALTASGALAGLADPDPVLRRIARRPVERLGATDFALLVLEDRGRALLWLALVPAFLLLPGRRS